MDSKQGQERAKNLCDSLAISQVKGSNNSTLMSFNMCVMHDTQVLLSNPDIRRELSIQRESKDGTMR